VSACKCGEKKATFKHEQHKQRNCPTGGQLHDLTVLLAQRPCTESCTIDFGKGLQYQGVVKADMRISIKDYHRKKNLKILLLRPPFPGREFLVRMNGAPWPAGGGTVSLTRLVTALPKALVRANPIGGP
jgi:hypothetical protein